MDSSKRSYAQLIYTPMGVTTKNVFVDHERVLHLGSGSRVLQGATTVDRLELPGVDLVHDLDVMPWPFEGESFDVVYAHNVLEHLDNLIEVMDEIWRLLSPRGRVIIAVPYFRSVDAFGDPTHRHFFTSGSMGPFIDADSMVGAYSYTAKRFKQVGFWYGWPQPSHNPLVRVFKRFIHAHPTLYDSHLSFLFPADILIWELEVIK